VTPVDRRADRPVCRRAARPHGPLPPDRMVSENQVGTSPCFA
jgi:hypothetical protein